MGVVATIAELGLTALVAIPYLLHNHQRSTSELKTLGAVHIFLIEGLLLGVVLLVGTLVKRRALLGFASLLVGIWLLQIKALSLLGIAYLGFGLWLVIKALKYTNKEGRVVVVPRAPAPAALRAAERHAGAGDRTRRARRPLVPAPPPSETARRPSPTSATRRRRRAAGPRRRNRPPRG